MTSVRRASAASWSRNRSAAAAAAGTSTFATTIARPNRLSMITTLSAIIRTASGRASVSAGGLGRRSSARTRSYPKQATAPPVKRGRPARTGPGRRRGNRSFGRRDEVAAGRVQWSCNRRAAWRGIALGDPVVRAALAPQPERLLKRGEVAVMACRIVHGPVDVADVGDLDGRSPGDVKGEVRGTDGESVHPGRRRDREGDG